MKRNKNIADIITKSTSVTADSLKRMKNQPSFTEQMKRDPANYEAFKKVIRDLAKK